METNFGERVIKRGKGDGINSPERSRFFYAGVRRELLRFIFLRASVSGTYRGDRGGGSNLHEGRERCS